jgi:predicted PurR-regulated permease PerM
MNNDITQAAKQKVQQVLNFLVLCTGVYFYSVFWAIPKYMYQTSQNLIQRIKLYISENTIKVLELTQKTIQDLSGKIVNRVKETFNALRHKLTQLLHNKVVELYNKYYENVILIVEKFRTYVFEHNITKKVQDTTRNVYERMIALVNNLVEKNQQLFAAVKNYFDKVVTVYSVIVAKIQALLDVVRKYYTFLLSIVKVAQERYTAAITYVNNILVYVQERSSTFYKQVLTPFVSEDYINSAKKQIVEIVDQTMAKISTKVSA